MFEFNEPVQLTPDLFCVHSPFICCMVCQAPLGTPELDLTMIPRGDDDEYDW